MEREIAIKSEIQTVLMSIDNVTVKIQRELDLINKLIQNNGGLDKAVEEAILNLKDAATSVNLDPEHILNSNMEEDAENVNGDLLTQTSSLTDEITKKLLEFMNK